METGPIVRGTRNPDTNLAFYNSFTITDVLMKTE